MRPGRVVPLEGRAGGYVRRAQEFLREVRVELRRVTWPSWRETRNTTLVVIGLVLVFALFLGAVDLGLSRLVRHILR